MLEELQNKSRPFPRSILLVSREEFGLKEDNPNAQYPPLELIIKAGALPADIAGQQPQYIQDLFNNWVYPQKEP